MQISCIRYATVVDLFRRKKLPSEVTSAASRPLSSASVKLAYIVADTVACSDIFDVYIDILYIFNYIQ